MPDTQVDHPSRREEAPPTGWVRVVQGRTRVVRENPDGSGWHWVEEDG
ncbi:hypothetical protein [Nonomuraea sp. NPDC001023]